MPRRDVSRRDSSPLMRGKLLRLGGHVRLDGLIPTHAGKTPACPSPFYRRWAHPRSRGENTAIPRRCVSRRGSSPLTRGKRHVVPPRRIHQGLIPAHTGKTASSKSHRPRTRAHPHSCGENVTLLPQQSAQPGSSPLTRGKLIDPLIALAVGGLIPAHAGKTSPFRLRVVAVGAHPRSRGENSSMVSTTTRGQGSSPLTRGKRAPSRAA